MLVSITGRFFSLIPVLWFENFSSVKESVSLKGNVQDLSTSKFDRSFPLVDITIQDFLYIFIYFDANEKWKLTEVLKEFFKTLISTNSIPQTFQILMKLFEIWLNFLYFLAGNKISNMPLEKEIIVFQLENHTLLILFFFSGICWSLYRLHEKINKAGLFYYTLNFYNWC